ncbi:MAG: hypothetical protein AAB459_04180 [Patescibacteria group bacterium]
MSFVHKTTGWLLLLLVLVATTITALINSTVFAAQEQGAVGIEATISAPPPSQGATISIPRDGQTFTTLPITVSGICPTGLLVKLFKNNVFSGSTQCNNGSFSIATDLFSGVNELVARVYDALDQAGPDSNKVNVSYNDARPGTSPRVTLTTNFAKRGADPGSLLTWPITISGGDGPYALSVDWGDGKALDLISQAFPGTFEIKHTYDNPGAYNIIVKASDKNGGVAYLQLVGIANGKSGQANTGSGNAEGGGGNAANNQQGINTSVKTKIVWQPAAVAVPFLVSTFWLGKKYEVRMLKRKIEEGIHPFK